MNVGKRNERSASLAQTLSAAVILVMATLVSSQASAEDGKVYPGAECRAYSGTVSTNNVGAVYNSSATNPASVICPIVHDTLGGSLDDINDAVVTVIDANNDSATQSVSCQLLAHLRTNGGWVGNWSPVQSSYNGDPVILNFDGLETSDNHHYYVRCTIPPRDQDTNIPSYIVSYRVDEQGG